MHLFATSSIVSIHYYSVNFDVVKKLRKLEKILIKKYLM